MRRGRLRGFRGFLWAVLVPCMGQTEDSVLVDMETGRTSLVPGQKTTVRVFGRINPLIVSADRIFSWNIDILNDNGLAVAGYENVQKPTSDNGQTSGDGTRAGDDLFGIFDFFLGTPGAGNGGRIELVRFDVNALALGTATLRVVPGTGGPGVFDFVVSKIAQ